MPVGPEDVLNFWVDAGPKMWWQKDDGFDAEIAQRFGNTHDAAARGELDAWLSKPDAGLALIIVLDQFSRNLFRNDARAFAQDEQCLRMVKSLMSSGHDRKMRHDIGMFCYMPLMHSEDLDDQKECLAQMERLGLKDNVKYAVIHLEIIEKFGRFPHRNAVLGRQTTPDEQKFLDDGGFSG